MLLPLKKQTKKLPKMDTLPDTLYTTYIFWEPFNQVHLVTKGTKAMEWLSN